MAKNNQQKLFILRAILIITLLLNTIALYQFALPAYESRILLASRRWIAAASAGVFSLSLVISLLILTWTSLHPRIFTALDRATRKLGRFGWLNILTFVLFIALYLALIYGRLGSYVESISIRLFLFWVLALIGTFHLKAWSTNKENEIQKSWIEFLGLSLLICGFSYQIVSFIPNISFYPFTLGWSETSRYYYASLFFAERIYGVSVPPTTLHPSRYLLQAVPFLLPVSPLWFHRAWQVILWIVIPLIAGNSLIQRVNITDPLRRWSLVIWIYLYLILEPVYYHLLIPVAIVLWGFNTGDKYGTKLRFTKSLVVVLLASAWAGISRINWFPVPGMLAAALYLLEEPIQGSTRVPPWRPIAQYVYKPAAWILFGTCIAFAAQAIYILWSGNPLEEFTTSFSSDLLWYRLLPNSTYPLGILPGILLVSLPLFLLILGKMTERLSGLPVWRMYHPIRLLLLVVLLTVLFAGGLLVSVKIGGGSNLHNLDAYMVLLLVITTLIFFDRSIPDRQLISAPHGTFSHLKDDIFSSQQNGGDWGKKLLTPLLAQQAGIVLGVIIPILFAVILRGPAPPPPDEKYVAKGLKRVANLTEAASKSGGEVLFISNRHLLTFHYIDGVPLVPEYERMFLMEMAMAGNSEYLGRFREDLKNQRFDLIISEPLHTIQKDESAIFGEENNAWITQVSQYILCYYEEEKETRQVHIQLLVPRTDAIECP